MKTSSWRRLCLQVTQISTKARMLRNAYQSGLRKGVPLVTPQWVHREVLIQMTSPCCLGPQSPLMQRVSSKDCVSWMVLITSKSPNPWTRLLTETRSSDLGRRLVRVALSSFSPMIDASSLRLWLSQRWNSSKHCFLTCTNISRPIQAPS
jgi:hypothetical protein